MGYGCVETFSVCRGVPPRLEIVAENNNLFMKKRAPPLN